MAFTDRMSVCLFISTPFHRAWEHQRSPQSAVPASKGIPTGHLNHERQLMSRLVIVRLQRQERPHRYSTRRPTTILFSRHQRPPHQFLLAERRNPELKERKRTCIRHTHQYTSERKTKKETTLLVLYSPRQDSPPRRAPLDIHHKHTFQLQQEYPVNCPGSRRRDIPVKGLQPSSEAFTRGTGCESLRTCRDSNRCYHASIPG